MMMDRELTPLKRLAFLAVPPTVPIQSHTRHSKRASAGGASLLWQRSWCLFEMLQTFKLHERGLSQHRLAPFMGLFLQLGLWLTIGYRCSFEGHVLVASGSRPLLNPNSTDGLLSRSTGPDFAFRRQQLERSECRMAVLHRVPCPNPQNPLSSFATLDLSLPPKLPQTSCPNRN